MHGRSANNGKSQFLEVYKALVPKEAVCALSLARLGDDRDIPLLAGKLLNCSAETPSAAILGSDVLKAVITGEEISGREVRRRVVKFKPVATHVIASNRLPSFEGMDQGILRRFLIVEFLRTIPENERIPELGNLIAQVEQDALLAWAVEGAMDLLKSGGFVEPPSSQTALEGWFKDADCSEGEPDRPTRL